MEVFEMKTLLLNQGFAPISFIDWKRTVKLVVRDKVDIISLWGASISFGKGEWELPSIIRLRHYTPYHIKRRRYNRSGVFKRDHNTCQFCGMQQKVNLLTIDHVTPRSQEGKTTWENCVTSCFDCNNKKADRTPNQAKMKLLNGKPRVPRLTIFNEFQLMKNKHDDWNEYVSG